MDDVQSTVDSTSMSELRICGPDTGGDYFRDCLSLLPVSSWPGQAAMSGPHPQHPDTFPSSLVRRQVSRQQVTRTTGRR